MTYETLLVERDGPIMTVLLNRPQKRNPRRGGAWWKQRKEKQSWRQRGGHDGRDYESVTRSRYQ